MSIPPCRNQDNLSCPQIHNAELKFAAILLLLLEGLGFNLLRIEMKLRLTSDSVLIKIRMSAMKIENISTLNRHDFIKYLGLGSASFLLLDKCGDSSGTYNPPEPQPEPVYELTDGTTLYDNFDGQGNLQSYDNQHLAEAGKLSSNLWDADLGVEVVDSEGQAAELYTIVKEYGWLDGGPEKIRWIGKEDGYFWDAKNQEVIPIIQGKEYGSAEMVYVLGKENNNRGYICKMTYSEERGDSRLELINPEKIDFVDYKSFSADVMLPSASTCEDYSCALDFHTSIPEQPPGVSWYTQIGIIKDPRAGFTYPFAQCRNKNTDYQFWGNFGHIKFDKWYNLRMDIVTKKEDDSLKDNELRIDFYVDNIKKASEIPPDSEILLDPNRLLFGPKRSLGIGKFKKSYGEAIAFFDNVKAVYKNRIS